MRWDNCVKIHYGCGGICLWRESMLEGVGYAGVCKECTTKNELDVEEMIPIEDVTVKEIEKIDLYKRKQLEWNENGSWEENQERIKKELGLL